jgi:nicotinamidase-related amidase
VKTVILGGFATDMCVLFTASDAYLRDIEIIVPPDCCAAATMEHHNQALQHMSRVLHVKTPSSIELNLADLVNCARQPQLAQRGR